MTTADDVIALFGLEPHPEGGWFRETLREPATTAIHYLLKAGERSQWHRIDATEIWHFYAGDPMGLAMSADGQEATHQVLGADLAAGQRPQVVVPPGVWQAARPRGAWSLVGCTVAPRLPVRGLRAGAARLAPWPVAPGT